MKSNRNKPRHYKQILDCISFILNISSKRKSVEDIVNDAVEMRITENQRKLYWLIYLNILKLEGSSSIHNWKKELIKQREEYDAKSDKYFKEKENEKHLDLVHLISIDVKRTYQEYDLFKEQKMKFLLEKILFIWSLENEDVSYVQGMNEIIGTIFYVVFSSNINFYRLHDEDEDEDEDEEEDGKIKNSTDNISEVNDKSKNDDLYYDMNRLNNGKGDEDIDYIDYKYYLNLKSLCYFIHDDDYMEHDIYIIYSLIMSKGYKYLFCYSENKITNTKEVDDYEMVCLNTNPDLDRITKENVSMIKKRINKIYDFYLKVTDIDTYKYYSNHNIEPYLFLFRWILCMLTREFPLKKLISIWDFIFSYEMNEIQYLNSTFNRLNNEYANNSKSNHKINFEVKSSKALFSYSYKSNDDLIKKLHDKKMSLNTTNTYSESYDTSIRYSVTEENVVKTFSNYIPSTFNFLDFFIVAMLIEFKSRVDKDKEMDEMSLLCNLMNYTVNEKEFKYLFMIAINVRDAVVSRLFDESNYVFL